MRLAAAAFALIVFIINPGFGCGEDLFQYGADEMKRAAEGTWEITVEGEAAPRAVFTLSHPYVPPNGPWGVRSAGACSGDRAFVAGASACGSSSSMTFRAATHTTQEPFGSVTAATLGVRSLVFHEGELIVEFDSKARAYIEVDPQGNVTRTAMRPSTPGGPALPIRAQRRIDAP